MMSPPGAARHERVEEKAQIVQPNQRKKRNPDAAWRQAAAAGEPPSERGPGQTRASRKPILALSTFSKRVRQLGRSVKGAVGGGALGALKIGGGNLDEGPVGGARAVHGVRPTRRRLAFRRRRAARRGRAGRRAHRLPARRTPDGVRAPTGRRGAASTAPASPSTAGSAISSVVWLCRRAYSRIAGEDRDLDDHDGGFFDARVHPTLRSDPSNIDSRAGEAQGTARE